MVLDPGLLDRARKAGTRLAETERQALLARAEYHTAVRRLHLAGASLREVARVLSLSHQRVQQIVDGAGGTWWRRAWRARTVRPDAVCTWCGRPPSEVAKLIAGPDAYICDGCVEAAGRAAAGRQPAGPFSRASRWHAGRRCAFCRKGARPGRPFVTAAAGHVCSECLRACREILDARAT